MRNPENRNRKPETQNSNSGFRVLAHEAYYHLHCQKPESETQKTGPKSEKHQKSGNYSRAKTLQSLERQGVSEKPRNPKRFWNFLRNPNSAKPLSTYLQQRNPETRYLPLHYMEGMRYPPWMEWRLPFLHLTNLNFYQQQNFKKHEQ